MLQSSNKFIKFPNNDFSWAENTVAAMKPLSEIVVAWSVHSRKLWLAEPRMVIKDLAIPVVHDSQKKIQTSDNSDIRY